MHANLYTKSLTGVLFTFFRDILIRYNSIDKIIHDNIKMKEHLEMSVENKVLKIS